MATSEFDLEVLSAGAPRDGVVGCLDAFAAASGLRTDLQFATAPVLREKVIDGEWAGDAIVAPLPVLDAFDAAGAILADRRAPVGSVRAGVVVPAEAPDPKIGTPEELRQTLLAADMVVHNVASSGIYIKAMIEKMGLAADLADKTVCTPTGTAVIETVVQNSGVTVIGFGQSTEIQRQAHLGARLAGPLPGNLAKSTTYAVAIRAGGDEAAAGQFLAFLETDAAREILAASGIE
jgi:molybdate transport system substrate-binding protein